ncbi:Pycsar system effector family protein [Streptomyces sp. NPDC087512]|uniref:Pycsar system effector family protein n=1 Tax=Streptomyces sp. NPDC087512 TaxID=3155059 RepID=UPI003419AE22
MSAPDPAPDALLLRVGAHLLSDLRAEIARADAKAAVLVAALGLSAGVPTALLANARWSPARLPAPVALLWWAGVVLLLAALLAVLLAVLPRYRTSHWAPGLPLTYFGDVRRAARSGHLATALADTGRDPARGLLIALAETSGIAVRKHFWIRAGLIAFSSAAVLLSGSLLLA